MIKPNSILCCDVFDGLSDIDSSSIDICITDPPYFLDSLDNKWDSEILISAPKNHIGNLPAGMAFSRNQTFELMDFYLKVSNEIIRVLKPGRVLFFIFITSFISFYCLGFKSSWI